MVHNLCNVRIKESFSKINKYLSQFLGLLCLGGPLGNVRAALLGGCKFISRGTLTCKFNFVIHHGVIYKL